MGQYAGLDVSMKETAISIRQDGKRIWRGKCASDPQILATVIRKRAPHAQRVPGRVPSTASLQVRTWAVFVCLTAPENLHHSGRTVGPCEFSIADVAPIRYVAGATPSWRLRQAAPSLWSRCGAAAVGAKRVG